MTAEMVKLGEEYLASIAGAIMNAPRSLQTVVGPSELGHPCARRLGYKMLGYAQSESKPNWKAAVGTAIHGWLETVFDQINLVWAVDHEGQERFLLETRVTVGDVDDVPIGGSCDLYDRHTAVVTDWKTTGPTALKNYRRYGPDSQYRAQAHLYGRGWQLAGYPVRFVQIVFLPRNGELAEAFIWSEPYDEQVAIEALTRATGIALATKILGNGALRSLGTYPKFCHLCPYFVAGSKDPSFGCPGDAAAKVNNFTVPTGDPFGVNTHKGASAS